MDLHHKLLGSVTTSSISHDADASKQQPSWYQEIDALTLVIDRACLPGSECSAGTDSATVKLHTTLEAGKDTNYEVGDSAQQRRRGRSTTCRIFGHHGSLTFAQILPTSSFATDDPVTNSHAQTTDMAIYTDQPAKYDIHIHRNYLPTSHANDQIALCLLMSNLAGTGNKSWLTLYPPC